MSPARQDIQLWRDPALGITGAELSCGRNVRFSFGPLIRDEVTIAVVTGGVLRHRIGRTESVARAGHVLLIAAGEPFAGEAASADGWSWRVFYPDLETLAELTSEILAGPPQIGLQPLGPLNFALARRLAMLHRAIEWNDDNPLARQQAFAAALASALQAGLQPPGWPRRGGPENPALSRAIACVHARFSDPELAIADLAVAAGYSQFHFMRSFAAAVGVTAHDYIVQCRLSAARTLLAQGAPAAEVAHAAGFADQSHLIRQFRSVLGTTPGQYAERSRRRAHALQVAAGVRPAPVGGSGGPGAAGSCGRSKG